MKKVLGLLIVLALVSTAAFADREIKVRIIQNPDGSITEGEAIGEVNVPFETVKDYLLQYDRMIEYVPNVQESRFIETTADGADKVYMRVKLSVFGERDMEMLYRNKVAPVALLMKFERIAGSWEYMKGYTMARKKDANTTLLTYHVAARSGLPLPGFAKESIMKDNVKGYISGVREKLE